MDDDYAHAGDELREPLEILYWKSYYESIGLTDDEAEAEMKGD